MKSIIYFFVFFIIPVVLAYDINSTNFFLNGEFVYGAGNFSSTNFSLNGVLGQMIGGNSSSANYHVDNGILGPSYGATAGAVKTGGAGGGVPNAGCAEGFILDDGQCIKIVNETAPASSIPKTGIPYYYTVLAFIVALVFLYSLISYKRKSKKMENQEPENDTFIYSK